MKKVFKLQSAYDSYVKDISKYNPLTAEEEKELSSIILKWQDAVKNNTVTRELAELGMASRDRMFFSNTKLVVKIAGEIKNTRGCDKLEIVTYGNDGLMAAVLKFDATKGYKFSTYAAFAIKNAIYDSLQKDDLIRIPNYVHDNRILIRNTIDEFNLKYNREPSIAEISKISGLKEDVIKNAMASWYSIDSLDQAIGDEKSDLGDFVPDEGMNACQKCVMDDTLRIFHDAVCSLKDERMTTILTERYGLFGYEKKSLTSIANELGISHQRASQLEQEAIKILKDVLVEMGITSFSL